MAVRVSLRDSNVIDAAAVVRLVGLWHTNELVEAQLIVSEYFHPFCFYLFQCQNTSSHENGQWHENFFCF